MTPQSIRAACSMDAETIVSWFSTHRDAVIWGGLEVPDPLSGSWLAQQFLDPQRRYYVLADERGCVCGTYFLYHLPEERRLHLGRFAVAPNLRGRGFASLMIAYAKDAACSLGVKKITLRVYEDNVIARRLYERAGFYVPEDANVETEPYGTVVPMRFDVSKP
jgi:RimJ/RimL family protein N-acetyltransferase